MSTLIKITCVILSVFGITQLSYAQGSTAEYEIEEGLVILTPARCMPDSCESTTAVLSGSMTATINVNDIEFSDIDVNTSPNIGFTLPAQPNISSNGTTREANYDLQGDLLIVSGIVDSRAFDGPLYEYKFSAHLGKGFDAYGYYTATQDLRKCVSPLCGGIHVKAVNKRFTRCADGSYQQQCYIGTPNWKELGFNPFSHAGNTYPFTPILLKGEIFAKDIKPFGNLGEFVAEAAYRPATNNVARGKFSALLNKGIYCITSPCFSTDEFTLNSQRTGTLSGFDLNPTGASQDDVDTAYHLYAENQPLLVAGRTKTQQELHGVGVSFFANQFYLPITLKKACSQGYNLNGNICETPFGCEAPQLELTSFGGAPMIDPITGEITGHISYSCVDKCDFPAEVSGPASCSIALP